jgi:hypothetical protein
MIATNAPNLRVPSYDSCVSAGDDINHITHQPLKNPEIVQKNRTDDHFSRAIRPQ